MGVKLIARGVGKGSMFGYGRLFWVHNPLGSRIGKAKDPYINLWTLSRLSRSPKIDTKNPAIENFSNRLKGPLDKSTVKFVFKMDCATISEVLSKDLYLHPWLQMPILQFMGRAWRDKQLPADLYKKALMKLTSYPKYEHSEIAKVAYFAVEKDLTSADLEEIAKQGPSSAIVEDIMSHPCMLRNIACHLANAEYEDESVNIKVYETIRPRLTPEELDILSQSKSGRILENVCFHPKAGAAAVAKAVFGLMQECGIVEYDCYGKSHRIYDRYELDRACIFILPRKEGILHILAELKKLDGELARLMTERIQSNEPLIMITEPKKYL